MDSSHISWATSCTDFGCEQWAGRSSPETYPLSSWNRSTTYLFLQSRQLPSTLGSIYYWLFAFCRGMNIPSMDLFCIDLQLNIIQLLISAGRARLFFHKSTDECSKGLEAFSIGSFVIWCFGFDLVHPSNGILMTSQIEINELVGSWNDNQFTIAVDNW